jgi:hypothetical protein
MTNASLSKTTRRALVVVTAAAIGLLGLAGPAGAADGRSDGRVTTGGSRLNVRSAPALDAPVLRKVADGQIVRLICQVKGDKINGHRRTSARWNRVAGGGYISDGYVKRGKVPPPCGPAKAKADATAIPVPNAEGWVSPVEVNTIGGFRTKARPTHDGVDMMAARNVRIHAAADGKVIVAECNTSNKSCDVDGSWKVRGCGWYVDIEHAGGLVTRYCHMIKKPYVKVGDTVTAGQVIGRIGSSGNSSGPHLHFEVHVPVDGKRWAQPTDPVKFYQNMDLKLGVNADTATTT